VRGHHKDLHVSLCQPSPFPHHRQSYSVDRKRCDKWRHDFLLMNEFKTNISSLKYANSLKLEHLWKGFVTIKKFPKSYLSSISLFDCRTGFKTTPENLVPSELVDDPPADHLSTQSCTLRLIIYSVGSLGNDKAVVAVVVVAAKLSEYESETWFRRHFNISCL